MGDVADHGYESLSHRTRGAQASARTRLDGSECTHVLEALFRLNAEAHANHPFGIGYESDMHDLTVAVHSEVNRRLLVSLDGLSDIIGVFDCCTANGVKDVARSQACIARNRHLAVDSIDRGGF